MSICMSLIAAPPCAHRSAVRLLDHLARWDSPHFIRLPRMLLCPELVLCFLLSAFFCFLLSAFFCFLGSQSLGNSTWLSGWVEVGSFCTQSIHLHYVHSHISGKIRFRQSSSSTCVLL